MQKLALAIATMIIVLMSCGDGTDAKYETVVTPNTTVSSSPAVQGPPPISIPAANQITVPSMSGASVVWVDETSIKVAGEILDTGGENPAWRGFLYGECPDPIGPVGDNVLQVLQGGHFGVGRYELEIRDLDPGTRYFVRTFGNNSGGTGYGQVSEVWTKTRVAITPAPVAIATIPMPTVSTMVGSPQPSAVPSPAAVNSGSVCVALGDSITAGTASSSYVPALSAMIGKPFVNLAVGGTWSAQGAAMIDGVLAQYHPACVSVYYGTNDNDLASARANLSYIVRQSKAAGAWVAISTLQPGVGLWAHRAPFHRALSSIIRGIAASEGVACADLEAAIPWDDSLFCLDGIHPNDRAVPSIAGVFAGVMK